MRSLCLCLYSVCLSVRLCVAMQFSLNLISLLVHLFVARFFSHIRFSFAILNYCMHNKQHGVLRDHRCYCSGFCKPIFLLRSQCRQLTSALSSVSSLLCENTFLYEIIRLHHSFLTFLCISLLLEFLCAYFSFFHIYCFYIVKVFHFGIVYSLLFQMPQLKC